MCRNTALFKLAKTCKLENDKKQKLLVPRITSDIFFTSNKKTIFSQSNNIIKYLKVTRLPVNYQNLFFLMKTTVSPF